MKTRDVVDLIVLLHFWLSSASVLMVAASAVVLGVDLRTVGVAIILPAILMSVVYVQDRRSPTSADRINQPRRTELVERYRRELRVSVLVALAGYQVLLAYVVAATVEIGPIFILFGQVPFAVLIGYQHLKRLPGLDSLVVGCTWAYIIVFSVVVSSGISISGELVLVFLTWALVVAAGAESRNVQDRTGDRMSGQPTLASRFGATATYLLEAVLKTVGVVIFWIVGGIQAAVIVLVWLVLLRLCRIAEQRRATVA